MEWKTRTVVAILAMLACFPGAVTTFYSPRRRDRSQRQDATSPTRVKSTILPQEDTSFPRKERRRVYRLMTWNLLAPVFTTAKKYSSCSPRALDWDSVRAPLIRHTIQTHHPDIVCLQEVQIDTWSNHLLPFFQEQCNYTCILQNVTRNHPVACAILVHRDVWQVMAVESRSRALLVVLQEQQRCHPQSAGGPCTVYLATVHLDAGGDQDLTRYCQIKSLFKRLEFHHHQQQQKRQGIKTKKPIVILAGDFNVLRTNPIYRLLAQGVYENGNAPKSVVPPNSVPSTLLPLQDVFDPPHASSSTPPLRRTFAGGAILDYIWVSRGLPSAQPWILDERCLHEKGCHDPPWPSMDQPSDHLPIGMIFSLEDDEYEQSCTS